MGDKKHRMGNPIHNSYEEIFGSQVLYQLVEESCLEAIPGRYSCAFQAYCGFGLMRNIANAGKTKSHILSSEHRNKMKLNFHHLFDLLDNSDDELLNIFWSWIENTPHLNTNISSRQ